MKLLSRIFGLLVMVLVLQETAAQERVIWLDEIDPQDNYVQDWGQPEINRSVVGTPFSVKGRKFERGIGAHAISHMLFDLGGKAKSIRGLVGADDQNLFTTRLEFKIIGDGRLLWTSDVMQCGDEAKPIDVKLTGVDKVLLLVDMCDDEFMYDFEIDLAELGINGAATVRDIWRNADEATGVKGNYKVSVPYYGVKFVKITPEKK